MEFLKVIILTGLIFIPLERLLALRPGQRVLRRGWLSDLVFLLANGKIVGLALAAIASGIVASSRLVDPSLQAAVASQPTWLQFIEVLILSDLGFYGAHRAFHAVPWLWRLHAVHHGIEELDWLAGARVHPIDQIVTKGASFLPVFALGFSDAAIGAYMLLYAWQSVFIHSNVKIKFGPLRWVLASPEFHHWHHGKDAEARDRNFAGQLPFLDLLFGTAHMPAGRMPAAYGIDAPMPDDYLSLLVHPFRAPAASTGGYERAEMN